MGAAAYRAAHQLVDGGNLFKDPLAVAILGGSPDELRAKADELPGGRGLRFFIAARSALAEAKLAEAVDQRGVTQLVVLGAGLDTFAYRSPFRDRLNIFEVDHPATQGWKRERLKAAGIAEPDHLAFVPVDFERASLAEALGNSAFDPARRSFFMWLGTVPYLTEAAIAATLTAVGSLEGGAEIVFDYGEPTPNPADAERFRALTERLVEIGEPLRSFFDPPAIHALLKESGFAHIEDYDPRKLVEYLWGPGVVAARAEAGEPIPDRGGHIVFASTMGLRNSLPEGS